MNNKFFIGAISATAVLALCAFSTVSFSSSDGIDKDPLSIVEDVPTCQAFLKDPVPEADLLRITHAGANAPSAMNMQPWHFTVVSDSKIIDDLVSAQKQAMGNMKMPPRPKDMPAGAPGMPKGMPKPPTGRGPKSGLGDSPAVIFISCNPGSEFDAGLACESMNDMANLLGYGTKIISSIKMMFGGDNKADLYKTLQVPEGQEIVAAILLGKADGAKYDAVSSATPRNDFENVASFLK